MTTTALRRKSNNPNGRPPGAPNKITAEVRDIVKLLVLHDFDRFTEELHKLKGNEYVTAYLKLMKLALPYTIDYRKLTTEQLQTVVEDMMA